MVMTANPITVAPGVLLPEAIHLMSERKLSEVPVIDQDRFPIGMLDITDVLQRVESADRLLRSNSDTVLPQPAIRSA
jgi:arabinose-5-phosphate isomerase